MPTEFQHSVSLWSWHSSDFSPCEHAFDNTRSEYWSDPTLTIETIYPALHDYLGSDQLVWCYTTPQPFFITHGQHKTVWVFQTPAKHVLFMHPNLWEDLVHGRKDIADIQMSDLFVESDQMSVTTAILDIQVAKSSLRTAASVIGNGRYESPTVLFDDSIRKLNRIVCRRPL